MKFEAHRIPIPLGHGLLRKMAGENPVVVNYHMVSDQDLPYIRSLYRYPSVAEFREHLRFYKRHYQIIHLQELSDHMDSGSPLPKDSLLITFDDGFREVHEIVAPILHEEGLPACFFICPDFLDNRKINHDNKQSQLVSLVEKGALASRLPKMEELLDANGIPGTTLSQKIIRIPYQKRVLIDELASLAAVDLEAVFSAYQPYMSLKQLRELSDMGFSIGGHSMDHARFVELSPEEQIRQALGSVSWIKEKLALSYGAFAFPYTDIGVGPAFFEQAAKELDLIFGTQGFMNDPLSFSFQRINAEKYGFSARRNLKYHFALKIIKNKLGRNQVRRS